MVMLKTGSAILRAYNNYISSLSIFLVLYGAALIRLKGTVSPCNKLFLNSTHDLDINFCANNNCSKVFIMKKSKIHIRRHFPRIDMGWRLLAHVCLWRHVSSCLHSTRWRYIVSINMASIKA